jgi:hypothetical protein
MIRSLTTCLTVLSVLIASENLQGRGFGGGGARGGMGGGFHGGGGSMGGMHSNYGGGMGGMRSGEYGGGMGGMRSTQRGGGQDGGMRSTQRGGAGEGGMRSGEFGGGDGGMRDGAFGAREGGAPSTSEMNRFLGMPSDGGMHTMSNGFTSATTRVPASSQASGRATGDNVDVNRGAVEGPRGGVAAGASATGPRGNTVDRGAAVGPNGGVAAGRSVEGADGRSAAQGVVAGPDGRVAAGGVARGADGAVAGRGVAAGDYGAVGGFGYMSPSARYGQAYGVRAGFVGNGLYTADWYGAHPGAWVGAGIAAGAWNAASWNNMNSWFGMTAAPMYYDYGNNVVAQGDNVYVDGQDAGTSEQYYDQAADLANAGAAAPADDANWLPLGVFAMSHGDQKTSHMAIQLAVDKQGTIRGNFTDTKTNQTLSVQGSVDKQAQRAAWTIGSKKEDVMETGLYNLTKDEVPAVLHYGKDRTEQWLLVRVKQDAAPPSQN